MAHTDLFKCNEALDNTRRKIDITLTALRAEMDQLDRQIEELQLKRAGMAMAFEIVQRHIK